jgi:multidrug efflux pump subunit AcrA (membrane-fusion protein)
MRTIVLQQLTAPGSSRPWPVVNTLAGTLLVCALLSGCGQKSTAGDEAGGAQQAMPVQVLAVVPEKIADTTEYLAILKSRHSATINPQVEGLSRALT